MRGTKLFRMQIIVLVCVGLMLPHTVMAAAPAPKVKINDVALGNGGVLVGHIVDQQGLGIAGAQLAVLQQGQKPRSGCRRQGREVPGRRPQRWDSSGCHRRWAGRLPTLDRQYGTAVGQAICFALEQTARSFVASTTAWAGGFFPHWPRVESSPASPLRLPTPVPRQPAHELRLDSRFPGYSDA